MLSVLLQERALCYNYRVLLWKNSDFKGKAMLELLSPAGSPEAVIAAVQNGADAVYMGLDGFNARRGAKNFSVTEFAKAVRYCHIRGCKVYVTLNTLVSDKEMEELVELARLASDTGADAILVQDLGVAAVLREAVPDIPLHASTQMSIHNLAGAEAAAHLDQFPDAHVLHGLSEKRGDLLRALQRAEELCIMLQLRLPDDGVVFAVRKL